MEETLPEIMPLDERKARLTKLARRTDFGRGFHGRGVIEAIDALNKIDGVYKQQIELTKEVVHTFVFVLPDGTKFIPGLPTKASPAQLSEPAITIEDGVKTT